MEPAEFARLKAKVDKAKPNSEAHHTARLNLARAVNEELLKGIPSKAKRLAIRRAIEGSGR